MASLLRDQVVLQMTLRGFSPRTHESYLHAMEDRRSVGLSGHVAYLEPETASTLSRALSGSGRSLGRRKRRFKNDAASLDNAETWDQLIEKLSRTKWIVYPKPTPASPEQTLEYLGRYTHKPP